jgi:restriction system protein
MEHKIVQVAGLEMAASVGVLGAVLVETDRQLDFTLAAGVLELGERVPDGVIVTAVALPWQRIVRMLRADPSLAFKIGPREWEEIVAGAYTAAGCQNVILTPRSGDGGRDVIATFDRFKIRIYDQVKAYSPRNRVTHNDVRAMLGVVMKPGVSKGYVTTTSDFEPGVYTDPWLSQNYPGRLELRDGKTLLAWLNELSA